MTLNFYTLSVIYLVYSFLGWVAETVVATIRGGRFANRGAAAGPFCFIYGTTGVLLAVSFGDLRTEPVYLFFACMMAATVMEWITAKLLERLHRRKWWDYSGKKFNLNGYVCLQYSLLWGALGTASVLWGNNVLLQLCAHIPAWLLRLAVWVSLTVAVLDQIGSAVLVRPGTRCWSSSTRDWGSGRIRCVAGSRFTLKNASSMLTRLRPGRSRLRSGRGKRTSSACPTCCGCS